jgi:hypothetical protein
MPYPYLIGRRGWTMDHREIKAALGIDSHKKVPADVTVTANVQGIFVCYMTSDGARRFWKNPGTNTPMRAIAECPDCGRIVPASRINQHAKVHQS